MAHGIRGGVISSLGGGKFKGGFLAGFLSGGFDEFSEASGLSDSIGWTGGLVSAAVVGGTAETIGGGKFENGAVTGAFGYLFNKAQHPERGRNANKGAWLKMSEITEYWGNAMNKLKDYIVNAINDPLAPGSEVVAGIEGAGAVFDERTLTIGLTGRGSNFFMAEGGVGLYIRWKINDITDLRFDVGYYKSVSIGAGIFDTGISVSGASYNNYDALDLRVGSINGSYHYYGGSVYYGESGDYMGVGTSLGLSLFKGGASTGYFFSSGAKMHSFINN